MINVFSIHKNESDEYSSIIKGFMHKIGAFSKIQNKILMNKDILKSQKINAIEAKKSYSRAYEKYLNNYTVALSPDGAVLDSHKFSNLLQESNISFFIAGAYGFEQEFLKKCNRVISLSPLTFSHKIAKIVLFEQIFRGHCISNNHPYHK